MATNIREISNSIVLLQRGNGVPTHISSQSTLFFDLDNPIIYINKDGAATWDYLLDSSTPITGGTSSADTYVTGFTYDNSNNLTLHRNDGINITTNIHTLTGITVTGLISASTISATTISATTYYGDGSNLSGISTSNFYTTGLTLNNTTYVLTGTRNDGGTYSANLAILASDVTITGGTYDNHTGVATFTNNSGATFQVSGFTTGITDTRISSFSYNNANQFSIIDSTGGTFNVIANTFTGLTATTISATTYQNLPTDIYVTGGTISRISNTSSILFTNNIGGTFNITPIIDVFVTGGTLNQSTGVATFTNNSGNTFNISGFYTNTNDVFVTGGTSNNSTKTYTFVNTTGGTFNVIGLTDIYTTGVINNNNLITLTNSTGGTVSTLFNTTTGFTVNGVLSATTIIASTLSATSITGITYTLPDISMPTSPPNGELILASFNQQGFSIPHIYDTQGNAIEITRDNITIARNNSGNSISKGSVVYITGSTGTVPVIALAKSNSSTTLPAFAIMYETTANNAFGRVMMIGNLEHIDLSAFNNGDLLYVSPTTAGGLTNIKPSYPNYIQSVGSVLNNGVGNGVLQVFIRIVQPLIDLYITGGTYNSNTGIATYTNTTGGTFNVSGFYTNANDIYTTSITNNNNLITLTNSTGGTISTLFNTVTGFTVTGIATVHSLTNPERLLVNDGNGTTGFSNTIIASANTNNYAQINITNSNSGNTASSDLVATANNGDELTNYINVGINSSTFNSSLGVANDSYVYSTGNDIWFGNAIANKNIYLFTDGTTSSNIRVTINSGSTKFNTPIIATTISATTMSANTYYNLPDSIGISLDGQGGVISTGVAGYRVMSYACRLTGWDIVSTLTGNVVFDIWKISSGNTLPTVSNSITGTNPPQLSGTLYSGSTNLATWTGTTFSVGDIVGYSVSSASSIIKATLSLRVLKQ